MNMNMNNHNNIIRYGEPFGRSSRRRIRRFAGIDYHDRSPETTAMNAHLRAAAYRDKEAPRNSAPDSNGGQAGAAGIGSLPNLLRQYDDQARDNFMKEAPLFAIITAIGFVWPMAHTMRVLLP
jgi:hypothetical protein